MYLGCSLCPVSTNCPSEPLCLPHLTRKMVSLRAPRHCHQPLVTCPGPKTAPVHCDGATVSAHLLMTMTDMDPLLKQSHALLTDLGVLALPLILIPMKPLPPCLPNPLQSMLVWSEVLLRSPLRILILQQPRHSITLRNCIPLPVLHDLPPNTPCHHGNSLRPNLLMSFVLNMHRSCSF